MQRARAIEDARREISKLPGVNGTFAADTFLPSDAVIHAGVDGVRLERRIAGFRKKTEAFALLSHASNGDELWRISARVSAFGGLDFNHLDKTLGSTMRKSVTSQTDFLEVQILGGVPMIASGQKQLLRDLLLSFCFAFVVASVGLALMLRSVRIGILLVFSNVLPILLVFGFLGWVRSPIDIGLVMTASAALGLAVDDSAHLLVGFRRALQRGQSTTHAADIALQQVAPAAIRTSLLCGLPMLVFAFSAFLPAARFGAVMAILIFVALFVDLVVLPKLLARYGAAKTQFDAPRVSG